MMSLSFQTARWQQKVRNGWLRAVSWLRRQSVGWHVTLHRPYHSRLFGRPLTHAEVGIAGEKLAAVWLRRHGRKVLLCNHESRFGGELDIVARHGEVLTFIEVKTRTFSTSRPVSTRPADAVDAEKRRLICNGALSWLRLLGNPKDVPIRFDIAEVILTAGELPRVHLIENAFSLPDSVMVGR